MMEVRQEDRRPFPGLGSDPQSVRGRVEAMERLLENPASLIETLWEFERDAQPLTTPEARALRSRPASKS